MTPLQKVCSSPLRYGLAFCPGLLLPHHFKAMEREALEMIADDEYNRLVIEIPFRHGKSQFWQIFCAWILTVAPYTKILYTAATAAMVQTLFIKIRPMLRRSLPLVGVGMSWDRQDSIGLEKDGQLLGGIWAISSRSSPQGKGFHWVIGDDLVADQVEANSPAERARLKTWFYADCLSRKEPGQPMKTVLIMSRKHPMDLIGECLLGNQAEVTASANWWHRITYPAISKEGLPLWPEMWNLKSLEATRQDLLARGEVHLWESLYQQNPITDPAASFFDQSWFNNVWYTGQVKDPLVSVLFLDPSMGKEEGDFSCLGHLVVDKGGTFYVDDVWLVRESPDNVEDMAVEYCKRYSYIRAFVIETNNFQERIAANIQRKCISKGLLNVPMYHRVHTSQENKIARIRHDLSTLLQNGRLKFRDCPANRFGVSFQMMPFPSGDHDDYPDGISMGVDMVDRLARGLPY